MKRTARFGARYGVSVKGLISQIETRAKMRYVCPECKYKKLRRVSSGIWQCDHCGLKMAGAAFVPESGVK